MRTTKSKIADVFEQCDEVSKMFRSLAHPVRLKVLCCLGDGEKRVGTITEFCSLEQASMSQFLKRMKDDGLVTSRRDGSSVYYQIADDRILKLMKAMKNIFC